MKQAVGAESEPKLIDEVLLCADNLCRRTMADKCDLFAVRDYPSIVPAKEIQPTREQDHFVRLETQEDDRAVMLRSLAGV